MGEHNYAKFLGIIVGLLTILGAIGFGVLSFIGIGLGRALNSGIEYSSERPLFMFIFVFSIGVTTLIGAFKLGNNRWRRFYIGICSILGIGLILSFFISRGALGTNNEIFILLLGAVYLLLGYIVYKNK